MWKRYCSETNRSGIPLIIFSPSERWRFNFLDYELSRPGDGAGLTENLGPAFWPIMDVAERSRGQQAQQDFWERTTSNSFVIVLIWSSWRVAVFCCMKFTM